MRARAGLSRVYSVEGPGGHEASRYFSHGPSTLGVSAMKPTIRSLICAATVLSAFCAPIPAVRADDATDYANQEREDWQNQLDQAQKDRDQLYQAEKEREDWQVSG